VIVNLVKTLHFPSRYIGNVVSQASFFHGKEGSGGHRLWWALGQPCALYSVMQRGVEMCFPLDVAMQSDE